MTNRELDAEVAEKVMGYTARWWSIHPGNVTLRELRVAFGEGRARPGVSVAGCRSEDDVPLEILLPDANGDMPIQEWLNAAGEVVSGGLHFSTSIADAWQVVEKMGDKFDCLYPSYDVEPLRLMHWVCVTRDGYGDTDHRKGHIGATAPEVICRAALEAVSHE